MELPAVSKETLTDTCSTATRQQKSRNEIAATYICSDFLGSETIKFHRRSSQSPEASSILVTGWS